MWEDQKHNLTLSIKKRPWTSSSELLKTLWPPTVGKGSMCVAKTMCATPGQPLGADIPPYLQRAAFRNRLQGIHLSKQHHTGLHLLTYHPRAPDEPPQPSGRIPATLLEMENMPCFFVQSTLRPHLRVCLDILTEEGYMNSRESAWSREIRTAPGFNICFEKRLRKSSLFSALEGRLQADPTTAFKTEQSKWPAQWSADYPVETFLTITLKNCRFSGNTEMVLNPLLWT